MLTCLRDASAADGLKRRPPVTDPIATSTMDDALLEALAALKMGSGVVGYASVVAYQPAFQRWKVSRCFIKLLRPNCAKLCLVAI